MAEQKKQVEQITDREADFARWYTDVVTRAELIGYAGIKGMYVLRPYGYAIWEAIQAELNRRFRETGHENVYLPMLIPESLLQKEKDHVAGFAPECAWVTFGGQEELEERLCIRPTSEVLFCEHFKQIVASYRDLPKLYNQWCSVLRWEKTARPFLRHREFLWQEGHTLHETAEEALRETERMLEIYADLFEGILAMPVVRGRKTEKEKFSGAERTYTVESMMHDKKALQSATSHFFGDGFTRAFGIAFTDRNNKLCHPYQTSWGITTRSIGGIVMTHGDNRGLMLPPRIAPIQVVVVPVAQHKPLVLETAGALYEEFCGAGLRVRMDDSDQSPGWKFSEYEMKGVPLRLEVGPRDVESGNCVLVRRDTLEKTIVPRALAVRTALELLEGIQKNLFECAKRNLEENTFPVFSLSEARACVESGGGFLKSMWCGSGDCENRMKEEAGLSARCIPFQQERLHDCCAICGGKAEHLVYWAVAY